jgi:hypothetical protein
MPTGLNLDFLLTYIIYKMKIILKECQDDGIENCKRKNIILEKQEYDQGILLTVGGVEVIVDTYELKLAINTLSEL